MRSIAGRVGALVSRELIPQLQFSHLVPDGSLKPRDAYFRVRIFSQCGFRVVHSTLGCHFCLSELSRIGQAFRLLVSEKKGIWAELCVSRHHLMADVLCV